MFALKSIIIDLSITVSSLNSAGPGTVILSVFSCSRRSTSGQRCDSARTEQSAEVGHIIGINQPRIVQPIDLN